MESLGSNESANESPDFSSKRKPNVDKGCEICVNKTPQCYYLFVAKVEYSIYLDSPQIKYFDKSTGMVYFNDERSYEVIKRISETEYVYFTDVIPHIFCSEKCEDVFINSNRTYILPEVAKLSGILANKDSFHHYYVNSDI